MNGAPVGSRQRPAVAAPAFAERHGETLDLGGRQSIQPQRAQVGQQVGVDEVPIVGECRLLAIRPDDGQPLLGQVGEGPHRRVLRPTTRHLDLGCGESGLCLALGGEPADPLLTPPPVGALRQLESVGPAVAAPGSRSPR